MSYYFNQPRRVRPMDYHRRHNNDCFTFGGVCSREYGVFLEDVKIGNTPKRDVSFQEIAGRSGDLIMDNNRWHNVEVTYCCVIPVAFAPKFEEFRGKLLCLSGYQELEDTIYPQVFRLGIITEPIKPEVMRRNDTGRFEVTFNCKPQRFLHEGTWAHEFTEESGLYNNFGHAAKPLITVYGTGPGTLTIGDATVEIKALEDQITLDCEMQNAYRQVGDAAVENKNSDIYAPEFPQLKSGLNAVSWTGDITEVHIVPRWWII